MTASWRGAGMSARTGDRCPACGAPRRWGASGDWRSYWLTDKAEALYDPDPDDRFWLTLAGYAALSRVDAHSGDTGCAQGQADTG